MTKGVSYNGNLPVRQAGVYGKVKTIDKGGNQKIHFYYNGLGQRTAKREMLLGTSPYECQWTIYRYDASGNLMATYDYYDDWTDTYQKVHLDLNEQYLYGSSRLGVNRRNKRLREYHHDGTTLLIDSVYPADSIQRVLGNKHYELSNHLGNVLATVTDRKRSQEYNTDGTTDYFVSDISSKTDYYAYGMIKPGRSYNPSFYRHGYQRSEKDNEVKGTGNSYTTHFRLLDPEASANGGLFQLRTCNIWYLVPRNTR